MINFKTSSITAGSHSATLLTFEIEGGNADPSDLAALNPPQVDGTKGIVISGRGPVWLFAALVHHYHVTQWVATYDPRQGAVVTSTHSRVAPPVGSVLEMPPLG